MNRRTKVIWFPACPALLLSAVWYVVTFDTPWAWALISQTFRIPFDVQHSWTLLLIALIPLALAGALAAGLSWRLGGARWERLVAAEIPLGMFCITQAYKLWRSGEWQGVQTRLALVGVSLFGGYLLAGALPFLLPANRKLAAQKP